jgi:hypothetical protein
MAVWLVLGVKLGETDPVAVTCSATTTHVCFFCLFFFWGVVFVVGGVTSVLKLGVPFP